MVSKTMFETQDGSQLLSIDSIVPAPMVVPAPTVTPESYTTDDLVPSYTIDLLNGASGSGGDSLSVSGLTVTATFTGGQFDGRTFTLDSNNYGFDGQHLVFSEDAVAALEARYSVGDALPAGAHVTVHAAYDVVDTVTGDSTPDTADLTVTGTTVTDESVAITDGSGEASGTITIDRGAGAVAATTTPDSFSVLATNDDGSNALDANGDTYDAGTFTIDANGHYTFVESDAAKLNVAAGDHVNAATTFSIGEAQQLQRSGVTTAELVGSGEQVPVTVEINGPTPATHTGGFAEFTTDTDRTFTTDLLSDTSDPDSTLSVAAGSVTLTLLNNRGQAIATPGGVPLAYTLDSDGTFHFDASQLNSLGVGQTDQVRVAYTVTGDTAGGDFSDFRIIVVSGTNDAPTLSNTTRTISESAINGHTADATINLLGNANDPEGAQLTVASGVTVSITTSNGITETLTQGTDYRYNGDGTITFNPGTYTQDLHNGQHDTIDVNYAVTDGTSTTATHDYVLTVNGAPDVIYGHGTFSGTGFDDQIFGDSNTDGTPATGAPTADTISAGAGNDVVDAGGNNDIVYGNAGDDQLYGGTGNDSLLGGQGNDVLNGGTGNDTLEGGVGTNTINGDGDIDTATYVHAASAVTVTLANQGAAQSTGISTDTFNGIENLTGSAFNDTLTGNNSGNTINGGAGNDTIFAGNGTNLIFGNTGDDLLHGGTGNDTLNGGQGSDILYTSHGDNVLAGGVGIDTVSYLGADSNVTVSLNVATQQSVYTYDGGGDMLVTVRDTLSGVENLIGSTHDDTLTGDGNANVIGGGAGNDTIFGLVGNDILSGGDGNDTLVGGQGDDTLDGGAGTNTLTGGVGADTFILNDNFSVILNRVGGPVANSPFPSATDTITDFSHADGDKIDLSHISSEVGTIVYSGATFSGQNNSLIVIQDPGAGIGHYAVEIDFDGNGSADFIAHVVGATTTTGNTTTYAPPPVEADFTGLASAQPIQVTHVDHHADIFG